MRRCSLAFRSDRRLEPLGRRPGDGLGCVVLGLLLADVGLPIEQLMQSRLDRQPHFVEREQVDFEPLAARQLRQAGHARQQRQAVEAQEVALDHRGADPPHAFLPQPTQAPVTLEPLLELGIVGVGGIEARDDREQVRVAGCVRRLLAARRRHDLPLVDQVDVAAQRRARPGVVINADSLVRPRRGARLRPVFPAAPIDFALSVDARDLDEGWPVWGRVLSERSVA